MATYKLIQDIEAEDHIIGPLTLRQFIFALISVFCFYICFLLLTKGVGFMMVLFLPPALFFGFFAIPFGRDQPTEVWALAKIRFWFKPRKRIWDQSGVKELVTITVPKKLEQHFTDGLSQYEVKSRLNVLATTLDSRGWAIKNANMSAVATPYVSGVVVDSDRLVNVDAMPEDTNEEADVLDETSSPLAQQFEQMIDRSSETRHQALVTSMNSSAPQVAEPVNNQWFMPQASTTQASNPMPVTAPEVPVADETASDSALIDKIKAEQKNQQLYSSNLRTLQPIGTTPTPQTNPTSDTSNWGTPQPAVPDPTLTDQPDPAILSLAGSNDLSIETIAHEAKRAKGDTLDQDEVVISLHKS